MGKSPFLVPAVVLLALVAPSRAQTSVLPESADELFETTKIWSIHLRFTADEWAAMEPKQNAPNLFGGGRPGEPRPGGPGRFGPSMFLAPTFVSEGDANADGALSGDEFRGLATKWFSTWDKENTGAVSGDQIRKAIDDALTQPPGGGGGPPALMLQGPEGKRNGLASMMGVEFDYVRADLDFAGEEGKDVAVRYKGNGTFLESRGSEKRSLKIDLNKNVKGQKIAGRTTLNLHCNVTDVAWMNEVLSHRLYRDAEVPAPRTAYARVFVTVEGKKDREYLGLYSLVEDIDKDFADENLGSKKGAIFKPVTPKLFADLGDDWAKYKQTYDPKTTIPVEDAERVIEFCRFVAKADDATFAEKLGDFLELEAFARYMAVTTWLATMDSILSSGQNFYTYLHPKTRRFQFVPWDLDHSFGQFFLGFTQEQRDGLSIRRPWRGENRFLDRVFKVEAFHKLYLAKMEEFSTTIFDPARFAQQVDEIAAAIRPAVEEESAEKLARFDKAVAGEKVSRGGFGGQGAQAIKAFVKVRAQSVRDQLAGKSEGVSAAPPPPRGGFRPGGFFSGIFMKAFDADQDGKMTRDECTQGFAGWFEKWNTDQSPKLSDEQLRAGLDRAFAFPFPAPGGPPTNPAP
jgi:spore coat protein H